MDECWRKRKKNGKSEGEGEEVETDIASGKSYEDKGGRDFSLLFSRGRG